MGLFVRRKRRKMWMVLKEKTVHESGGDKGKRE